MWHIARQIDHCPDKADAGLRKEDLHSHKVAREAVARQVADGVLCTRFLDQTTIHPNPLISESQLV